MKKTKKMPTGLPVLLLAAALLALMMPGLLAQAAGVISGKITDATGALIPGAEVTVTHLGTGAERTAVSTDSGLFRVTNLNPGRYTVKAALSGFKTSVSEPLDLTVGEVAHVELQLQVGDISDEVIVTGAAATIDVEQGRVSTLVDEKKVANLPLNGRNVMQLVRLAPGSVNAAATISEPGADNAVGNAGSDFDGSGGQTSVNGGRVNMNGFWIDGVSAKQLSGGLTSTPSVDSVQEFRLETLNFSAEYGASVGSVVSVITKSGSNQFHGSAYEFHRNDNADAREFFDTTKPEFKQNQFGFTIGGPVIKDKSFFFFSYEGIRIRTGNTALTTFESGAWRDFVLGNGQPVAQFLYSNFGGPPLESNIQTVGQYLTAQGHTPDASQGSVDAFLGDTFGSAPGALSAASPMAGDVAFFTPNPTDGDQFSIRFDQELGDSDKIYGRYIFDDQDAVVIDPRPAFNSPAKIRTHNAVVNWTKIISPSMVNEARVGFNRAINDVLAGNPGVPRLSDTGTGTAVFGAYNGYPQIFHENTFTWADTLSLTKGRHGMKMGVEVRRNQENSEFNVGRPSYYFFDLVSLALDDPYYQIGGVDPGQSGANQAQLASNFRAWRGTEVSFFFNDDFKLRPNLTLNLGIRWDWFGRLTEDQDRATRYNLDNGNTIFERVALGGFEAADQLSSDDFNNFAPRLGIAWDPFGDGKMSIRAGYGLAYNGAIYNPLANSRWNPPFYSFNLICRFDICGRPNETILLGPQNGDPVSSTGANPNPGGALFEGNIIAYDPANNNTNFLSGIPNPDMRDPYVQSFFWGVQREIARNMAFEANYVGTIGTKLIRAENFNRFNGDFLGAPSPAGGSFAGDTSLNRVNPAFGVLRFWENSVNSNYHSLQLQLDKRYSNGFAFNANYTLAKSLDTRSTWHSGATSANRGQEGFSTDVNALFLDYGRSIFDARHRFTTNFIYETPFFRDSGGLAKTVLGGWQINSVISLQSGQPFTPHLSTSFAGGGDFNADGTGNDRTDIPSIGNTLGSVSRNDYANGLFNGVVFPSPTPGTTGDLGRNTFEGPGFANVDFSLFKDFSLAGKLSEESKLQFRVEFFNLFNRVNFLQPEPRINFAQFGRTTDTFDAREIQFGLKFIF